MAAQSAQAIALVEALGACHKGCKPLDRYESILLDLPRYGDQGTRALNPGQDRVTALLDAMGNPHRRFKSIHVAGTNGKGSTASMIAAILRAAGLERVGLYTSPHLISLRERIRLDGKEVPTSWMEGAMDRFGGVIARVQPSFFESLTALAFLFFAEEEVSVAVVEVGLGGRLDATNVLTPRLSVITHIDLDHTHILGPSLSAIAREKAGIIKPAVPVVTGVDQEEALSQIRSAAREAQAPLHVTPQTCSVRAEEDLNLTITTPDRQYAGLDLPLAGDHQRSNAALAIRAVELYGAPEPQAIRSGLRLLQELSGLRGRLETVQQEPWVVVDVAHNEAGLRAALSYVRARCARRLFVLIGLVHSKDADAIAKALLEARALVYPCDIAARRGRSARDLGRILASWNVPVTGTGNLQANYRHALGRASTGDTVLVTGSHYLVGAFLQHEPQN